MTVGLILLRIWSDNDADGGPLASEDNCAGWQEYHSIHIMAKKTGSNQTLGFNNEFLNVRFDQLDVLQPLRPDLFPDCSSIPGDMSTPPTLP